MNYIAIATFDGQTRIHPYMTRLMTLRAQLEGPLCVVFDVLVWDNFTVTLVTADDPEQTLLSKNPADVVKPLWQRFALTISSSGGDGQVVFSSYHTPGFPPYSAAIDNVSTYNMSCFPKGSGNYGPGMDAPPSESLVTK